MAEDFNPRAPCGARRSGGCGKGLRTIFQSTRPMRGATQTRATEELRIYYFNPRAPCGARLIDQLEFEKYSTISIHAPHAGRDPFLKRENDADHISIHAPHAGRD